MTTPNPAAAGGFKTEQIAARVQAESAYRATCAKLGMPEAANVRPGGNVRQLHEGRKLVRQVINKARAEVGTVGELSPEQAQFFDHAGNLIAQIDTMLDSADQEATGAAEHWRAQDGALMPVLRGPEQIRAHYGRRAADAGEEICLADFLRGVAGMKTTQAVRNALSVGTDTAGGFSVPSLVMPSILEALAPESSLLTAGAGIVPMSEGGKSFTTAAINALPTAAWRSEGGAVAESDPTFRAVTAIPQSLAFVVKVTRELLADSPNLGSALETSFAQTAAKKLDYAGLRGTGTAPEPRGILNIAGIQAVTNGANGASLATTAYTNLISAIQSLLAADAPMPTAAIMAPRSLTTLGGLLDTTNQPRQRPDLLSNMRFIPTSQIPVNLTVGTSNDCSEIYVGNFSRMFFLMREQMSVQLLTERYADSGHVGFLVHMRADVVVEYPAAFAVITGVRA